MSKKSSSLFNRFWMFPIFLNSILLIILDEVYSRIAGIGVTGTVIASWDTIH